MFVPVSGNLNVKATRTSSGLGPPNFGGVNSSGSPAAPPHSALGFMQGNPVPAKTTSKLDTVEILSYPTNVVTDEQQGHYIMFEIYEQNPAKLAATKGLNAIKGALGKAEKQTGSDDTNDGAHADGDQIKNSEEDVKEFKKSSGPNSLQLAKNATKRMDTVVALYMPPTVQVSYGANYNEQEIGVMAESANAAISAFSDSRTGGADILDSFVSGVKAAAPGAISGVVNSLKQAAPQGSAAIFAINSGSVITPRMELMFEGIQRRNFSFNFDFIPKSAQEAHIIEKIVKKFKYHMAANFGRRGGLGGIDGVREMTIPDFFQITYMYLGDANPHLNLIKKCVLLNTSVEYGADRFKAFANGQPQTTKLSLNFSELEIITKDYVSQGY